ncbi:MAG: YciI family protein [Flammeovirgaceae bacterium]|nr:YciI family protein [Flammeovirgaceae bacterium]
MVKRGQKSFLFIRKFIVVKNEEKMRCLLTLFFILNSFLAISQEKQFTFVFLNNKPDKKVLPKEEAEAIQKDHMANIERLAKEGKLIAAGPFDGGGGIFIFNTTSVDETKEWLSTDPGVRAERWNIEILSYTPRIGSVCAVGEPYEMVTYALVRFNALITKATAGTFPDIFRRHLDYVKSLATTGNVVSYGSFGSYDGGVLIMKGEVQQEVIENDPGVEAGLMDVSIKKLWIAKGSFCEK